MIYQPPHLFKLSEPGTFGVTTKYKDLTMGAEKDLAVVAYMKTEPVCKHTLPVLHLWEDETKGTTFGLRCGSSQQKAHCAYAIGL